MARAIRIHRVGGPEVLTLEQVDVGKPGPGQVRLRHGAVGLNYADTYFRSGVYPVPLPSGMGVEGAGYVLEVGDGVETVGVGDRVTYTGFINTLGAYSDERLVPASALIRLPDAISFDTAAAMTMRGLTAAYVCRSILPRAGGSTVLLHAAAGGVGLIIAQWAKLLGITVIGTVSTEEKAALARANGVTHTILHGRSDMVAQVKALTGGRGVDVVLDSIGRETFGISLDCLTRRGLMVCLGTASGTIEGFNPNLLAMKGSLYLTRPALADYIADPVEKAALADEIFGHVAAGRIRIEIGQRYRLEDAVRAHQDLETRKTMGSSILTV